MLSFSAPAWLIGFVLLPLIWWLHRLGDPDAAAPVSAAFLFSASADEAPAGSALPRAHPLWILRAAIFGLLVLVLAGPFWPSSERRVTVWFDDSLSMQAGENGEPRARLAARALGAALDDADPSRVRIHLLGDHRQTFEAAGFAGERRVAAISEWVSSNTTGSPPRRPLVLPQATEHWLVTDGADQRVNDWPGDAAFARTITAGATTENAAVTALMARRSLRRDAPHRGAVRVGNLGTRGSTRTLAVSADERVIFDTGVEIPPGGTAVYGFEIPVVAGTVTATLSPGDALAQDDTLTTGLDGLRAVAVDFDARCGARLGAVLRAHPGLALQAGAERGAGLAVSCGPAPEPAHAPAIRVHAGGDLQPVTGPVQWQRPLPGVPGLRLDPSWLRFNAAAARPLSALTLLGSPGMGFSLIEGRAGSLEVFLDLETAPFAERSEYPLLVNALVELALERPVLDPVVRAARPLDESRIARQPMPDARPAPAVAQPAGTDPAPVLLTLAILLVLADLLLVRPARPLRRRASRGLR